MHGSASSAQAVLQNPPSSAAALENPPDVHIVFYNVGMKTTQVNTENAYKKWIRRKLRSDVRKAVVEQDAHIIALCELGGIEEGLGPSLALWKRSNRVRKTGDYHLVEDLLQDLVDDPDIIAKRPSGWSVHASAHYGLLVSKDRVQLVDAPERVGPMTSHQRYRVAQRCSFRAISNSVEKPVRPVELWNVHCPASQKYPYGPLARKEVCQFLQRNSSRRVIWGGDINQSIQALKNQTRWHDANLEPWQPFQPGNGLHGDVVLARGVTLDLMLCRIGKNYGPLCTSDAHVMVGIVLETEFDSPAKPVNTVPARVVRPILLPGHVVERVKASSASVSERDAPGESDVTPTVPVITDVHDAESDVDRRSESGADFGDSESDTTTSLMTDEPQWNESEDDDAARSLIDSLSNQLDGEHGPPANADDIHLLIRFLWFGKQFQFNEIDAYQRGQTRLAGILAEVRWIRDRFSSDANPAGDRILSEDEVAKIHNQYRNSMWWMPGQVWDKYCALLDAAEHEAKGRRKGKRNWKRKGERTVSFNQRAHQFRRQTFNVYFFKLFGSKALFFHLVKTGARNISIQDLLQQWTTFKTSDEYSKLIQCSAEKSAAEIELKSKRDRLRFAVLKKRNQGASEEVLMQLERELQEATDAYAATGRAGKRRGVAHHLM